MFDRFFHKFNNCFSPEIRSNFTALYAVLSISIFRKMILVLYWKIVFFSEFFLLYGIGYTRRDSIISGFRGPPSASGQRLCGLDRGRSLVVNSRVKSLASPDQPKPDGKSLFWEITFSLSNSDIAGVARLLTRDFTTRDRPLSKPQSICPLALGGPRNPEIIESRPGYTIEN